MITPGAARLGLFFWASASFFRAPSKSPVRSSFSAASISGNLSPAGSGAASVAAAPESAATAFAAAGLPAELFAAAGSAPCADSDIVRRQTNNIGLQGFAIRGGRLWRFWITPDFKLTSADGYFIFGLSEMHPPHLLSCFAAGGVAAPPQPSGSSSPRPGSANDPPLNRDAWACTHYACGVAAFPPLPPAFHRLATRLVATSPERLRRVASLLVRSEFSRPQSTAQSLSPTQHE